MALTRKKLWVDIDGGQLVADENNPTTAVLPPFFQGDTVELQIVLLRRTASYPMSIGSVSPFTRVDPTGIALRVGVGVPTPTVGSGEPIALQSTWSIDSTEKAFIGSLFLSPSACATVLAGATSVTLSLEIETSEGGAYSTLVQTPVELRAELIESGTGELPQPADEYYTKAQCNALFLSKAGEAGIGVILVSPDGTKRIQIWLDNNGMLHQDLIS